MAKARASELVGELVDAVMALPEDEQRRIFCELHRQRTGKDNGAEVWAKLGELAKRRAEQA